MKPYCSTIDARRDYCSSEIERWCSKLKQLDIDAYVLANNHYQGFAPSTTNFGVFETSEANSCLKKENGKLIFSAF